jgi:hypothetical protein
MEVEALAEGAIEDVIELLKKKAVAEAEGEGEGSAGGEAQSKSGRSGVREIEEDQ